MKKIEESINVIGEDANVICLAYTRYSQKVSKIYSLVRLLEDFQKIIVVNLVKIT